MMKHKYHEHVKYPMTSDELAVLMDPWTRAGFPGCIGCIDGVHSPWGGYRAGFEGNVTLSAGDYDLPGWIGDVEVNLIVEGVRQND